MVKGKWRFESELKIDLKLGFSVLGNLTIDTHEDHFKSYFYYFAHCPLPQYLKPFHNTQFEMKFWILRNIRFNFISFQIQIGASFVNSAKLKAPPPDSSLFSVSAHFWGENVVFLLKILFLTTFLGEIQIWNWSLENYGFDV